MSSAQPPIQIPWGLIMQRAGVTRHDIQTEASAPRVGSEASMSFLVDDMSGFRGPFPQASEGIHASAGNTRCVGYRSVRGCWIDGGRNFGGTCDLTTMSVPAWQATGLDDDTSGLTSFQRPALAFDLALPGSFGGGNPAASAPDRGYLLDGGGFSFGNKGLWIGPGRVLVLYTGNGGALNISFRLREPIK